LIAKSRRLRSGWIAGLVVGVTAGFATLEIPPLGWLLVVVFAIPALIVGPRFAAIGGLLTGLGGVWLALLGRVALTCQATGEELGCHAPGIEPWLSVGGAMLAIGLFLSIVASVLRRRPR
jgi:hypothetical protein